MHRVATLLGNLCCGFLWVSGVFFGFRLQLSQALLAELRRQKEEFLVALREAGADVEFLEATGCRYTVQVIEIGQGRSRMVKVEMDCQGFSVSHSARCFTFDSCQDLDLFSIALALQHPEVRDFLHVLAKGFSAWTDILYWVGNGGHQDGHLTSFRQRNQVDEVQVNIVQLCF